MFYSEELSYLMTPGPVEIHPRVQRAMLLPIYGHRTDHFRAIYDECIELLRPIYGITGDESLFILSGSGSIALAASLENVISSGDRVISLVNGKFSKRQAMFSRRLGAEVTEVEVEWGQPVTSLELKMALEGTPEPEVVTVCHNETSTGVLNPVSEICELVRDVGALSSVDCITSIGGDVVKTSEWKMDLVSTGSQKCLGLPPGLAFLSVDDLAFERSEKREVTSLYASFIDLKKAAESSAKTPFTPAISLIYGLHESLKIMHEEGIEQRYKRGREMGEILRVAAEVLGLELLAKPGYYSNTVTAIKVPEGIDFQLLMLSMRKLGILIAGGQNHYKGRMIRINHMNLTGPREILMTISALELSLRRAGYKFDNGSGTEAAHDLLMKYGYV